MGRITASHDPAVAAAASEGESAEAIALEIARGCSEIEDVAEASLRRFENGDLVTAFSSLASEEIVSESNPSCSITANVSRYSKIGTRNKYSFSATSCNGEKSPA